MSLTTSLKIQLDLSQNTHDPNCGVPQLKHKNNYA